MPIPSKDIKTECLWVYPNETVAEVLAKLPANRNERAFKYVVIPVAGGRYIVVRWLEVEQIAVMMKQNINGLQIGSLQGLPQPVEGVEQDSMGINSARELRDAQPGKLLVVLSNGTPIGLLTVETLASETLGADPFVAVPKRPVILTAADEEEQPQAAPTTAVNGAVAPEPQVDNRVINGWVEGLGKTDPLQRGQTYELKVNVAPPKAEARFTGGGIQALVQQLAEDQELIEMLVVLEPGDFTLYGLDQQLIILPRVGNSKNTAVFTIEPKKEGSGTLNVLFYVNNRVFQKVTMTFKVVKPGTPAAVLGTEEAAKTMTVQATGISLPSAVANPAHFQGQPINVMIIKKEDGYQFIVQGAGVARALLRISEAQIADWIKNARKELKGIVHKQINGQYVYQVDDTTIAPDVHAATLKTLANVGYLLYEGLFFGGNGPDVQAMGRLLAELSQKRQLYIQVAGDRFFFPWALLYDREDLDNIDPQGFWGFKHIIEYTPEFSSPTPVSFDPNIAVGDTMDIGFVCNDAIDTQFQRPIVAGQRDFLGTLPGVSLKNYPTISDLTTLLNTPDAPPLIYIYCHAVSKFPNEDGGVDDSTLALTDGKVMLRQLKLNASTRRGTFSRAPLIYLNACESAELSPYLYDGLVPYLIQKGARGVLGTEVETPALFAAEFAKEFIKRFVAGGQPLGDLLLDLRREYLEQKNNVMGLVYALYSSGDVVVQRN